MWATKLNIYIFTKKQSKMLLSYHSKILISVKVTLKLAGTGPDRGKIAYAFHCYPDFENNILIRN